MASPLFALSKPFTFSATKTFGLKCLSSLQISKNNFPLNTLIANFFGCFLVGYLVGWILNKYGYQNELYLFLVIGFCGGLTTFSTFSNESLLLLRSGNFVTFLSYTLISIIGGILLASLGYQLFKLSTSY